MYVTGTHALLIRTASNVGGWNNGQYDAKLCVGCVPIGTVTIPHLSLHFRVSLVCTWCLMGVADHTAAESELPASFIWYVNALALHLLDIQLMFGLSKHQSMVYTVYSGTPLNGPPEQQTPMI